MQITKLFVFIFVLQCLFCKDTHETNKKIRLGVPPRASFIPVFIAQEQGIFKNHGLDIELIHNENIYELYSERKLDIICTGLTEAILSASEGHPTQIVYRFTYSINNDLIIANPKIKDIKSLRQKKVAFNGINTSSHIFVQQLLSKSGIYEGEYYALNLPSSRVIEELEKGTIDAGHTNGVSVSEITKKGWNIIGKSSDDPDLLSDTLSVDILFSKKHSADIEKIITSIVEAKDMYIANPDEAISLFSNKLGKNREEVAEELKGLRFLSLRENIQSLKTSEQDIAPMYSPNTSMTGNISTGMSFNMNNKKGGLFTAGETIVLFLSERGQLYKMPTLEIIINDNFVKSIEVK